MCLDHWEKMFKSSVYSYISIHQKMFCNTHLYLKILSLTLSDICFIYVISVIVSSARKYLCLSLLGTNEFSEILNEFYLYETWFWPCLNCFISKWQEVLRFHVWIVLCFFSPQLYAVSFCTVFGMRSYIRVYHIAGCF